MAKRVVVYSSGLYCGSLWQKVSFYSRVCGKVCGTMSVSCSSWKVSVYSRWVNVAQCVAAAWELTRHARRRCCALQWEGWLWLRSVGVGGDGCRVTRGEQNEPALLLFQRQWEEERGWSELSLSLLACAYLKGKGRQFQGNLKQSIAGDWDCQIDGQSGLSKQIYLIIPMQRLTGIYLNFPNCNVKFFNQM